MEQVRPACSMLCSLTPIHLQCLLMHVCMLISMLYRAVLNFRAYVLQQQRFQVPRWIETAMFNQCYCWAAYFVLLQAQSASERGSQADVVHAAEELQVQHVCLSAGCIAFNLQVLQHGWSLIQHDIASMQQQVLMHTSPSLPFEIAAIVHALQNAWHLIQQDIAWGQNLSCDAHARTLSQVPHDK